MKDSPRKVTFEGRPDKIRQVVSVSGITVFLATARTEQTQGHTWFFQE